MQFKKLNDTCYYFEGAVNIGYVHHGEEGLLIDAGIDKSSIKKVIRKLKEEELPITHLFVTHAHADHYGGAYVLQKDFNVKTIAPRFEKAILENPMLEPLYLFGGNDPLDELRNKFLEGTPIQVHEVVDQGQYTFDSFQMSVFILPGHSYFQAGIVIDNIFYAADAYFSEEQLNKHKIPYITDAQMTIESLQKASEITCQGAVPGHGMYEEHFQPTIQKNVEYHEKVLTDLEIFISNNPDGVTHEQTVAYMCETYGVNTPQLSQFLLYRTAVTAYLIGLVKRKKLKTDIQRSCWVFYINEGEG
ncbi:glyoxylase-like metal-dependent hydrolase (beta-lactamase superfamily II) [Salirhabdus euzebyi]|uniref:Glyoxylase-like metal-dependent hydrolase (Beta-lactamase superfamily II) n=1 Tax=Salirhabdus euzebyi TaxID=394506 RepID=A0A841Q3Y1_9BACI|nr:MBL fold metallo-hydrolase [Salirhabdus euzebyi]MBB6453072.1 glyoxylase-like metal-dependent hydrolase (beta-lactamase superfamily II) [Salirhabdus euzebyi]